MSKLQLYSYWRSSASFRVRIALNLKNADYDYHAVHLLNNGGEQHKSDFRKLNPMGEVPCLIVDGVVLSQSMAILNFLDSRYADNPLFPADAMDRAQVITLCEIVNSSIHPMQNLKTTQELERRFGIDTAGVEGWVQHWIDRGFTAIEKILEKSAGTYCFGGNITAADVYVVPQIFTARRFKVDVTKYPQITRVGENCMKLDAFKKAEWTQQPDAPPA